MKKYLGVFMAFAAACALCLGLVGCGGDASEPDPTAQYVGKWDLTSMVVDGEETTSDELATMSALGMEIYLDLKADRTFDLMMFGEAIEGTWAVKSDTELDVTIEGETVTAMVEGDTLKLTQEGTEMTFTKRAEEAEEATETTEAAESSASAAESSSAAASDAAASESTAAAADEAASESTDAAAVDEAASESTDAAAADDAAADEEAEE